MELTDLKRELADLRKELNELKIQTSANNAHRNNKQMLCTNGKGQDVEPPQQSTTSLRIQELTEKYGNGLTMHGLTYVYNGSPAEKICWMIIVIVALGFLSYGLMSLTRRFCSYQVNQSSNVHDLLKMKLPSIRICGFNALVELYVSYKKFLDPAAPSDIHLIHCAQVDFADPVKKTPCSGEVGTVLKGACIVVNANQTEYQFRPGAGLIYGFEVDDYDEEEGFPSDIALYESSNPPIINPDEEYLIVLERGQRYRIEIIETLQYKLLPPPYQNDNYQCLPGTLASLHLEGKEKFPCMKSCATFKELETCGGISDLFQSYVKESTIAQYKTNRSDEEISQCITRMVEESIVYDWKMCANCPEPCQRTVFKRAPVTTSMIPYNVSNNMFEIEVVFSNFQIEQIVETPKYPWFSFLAEFGGFLGLLTGVSAISIIELIILVVLITSSNLMNRHKRTEPSQA